MKPRLMAAKLPPFTALGPRPVLEGAAYPAWHWRWWHSVTFNDYYEGSGMDVSKFQAEIRSLQPNIGSVQTCPASAVKCSSFTTLR